MSAEPSRRIPYSVDIRWRVVWQRIAMNLTFQQISTRLNIDPSTAYRVYNLFKITGDVQPKLQKGVIWPEARKLNNSLELFIVGLIIEQPGSYLSEVCEAVLQISGVSVSEATICRIFKRYGFTRKKMQSVALQRSAQLRGAFMAQAILYRREMFVWVDEMGSDNRNTMRKFGYAIKGQTPQCHRFLVRGKRISVIAAISTGGLVAAEYFHGTVNSDTFYDFARGSLIPQMNSFDGSSPNSIIIMDNCKIHHVADVIELFRSVGILVLFLPPYSPDFNPIEETFSYVKYYLKNEHLLQTIPDPLPLIKHAFKSITAEHCNSWINDCGYN